MNIENDGMMETFRRQWNTWNEEGTCNITRTIKHTVSYQITGRKENSKRQEFIRQLVEKCAQPNISQEKESFYFYLLFSHFLGV